VTRAAKALSFSVTQQFKTQRDREIAQVIPIAALLGGAADGAGGHEGGERTGGHSELPSQTRPGNFTEPRRLAPGEQTPAHAVTAFEPNKTYVVEFWATWCPPCIDEFPSLDAFQRQMKNSGVVVLGVSIDKNEQAYKTFIKQNRPSIQLSRDSEANIASDYGTFKWPETYVIDAAGVVRYHGPIDDSQNEPLLQNPTPPPPNSSPASSTISTPSADAI
jgi:thiol-disulfide isomerase/thioredoxin